MKLWAFHSSCADTASKLQGFKRSEHSDTWWFVELIAAVQDQSVTVPC